MSNDPNQSQTESQTEAEIEDLRSRLRGLREKLDGVFFGYRDQVDLLIQAFLSGGHILLEGAPGLGKTTLVHALANALELDFQRIQFTPDLMPADILGSRILEEDPNTGRRSFNFERGPIFANVVLADEINRATPRTQSALLEAMQEGQVTLHGTSYELDQPFLVIATENPVEMEGTYPLPEAQLDRFVCKIELDSPGQAQLVKILSATTGSKHEEVAACLSKEALLRARKLVRGVLASSEIIALVAKLVRATDPKSDIAPDSIKRLVRFGASPRGGQSILLLSKARALLAGRVFINRADLEATLCPALRHRLVLSYEAEAEAVAPDELIREVFAALS